MNTVTDNKESHLRSILKGLSWRVLATLTTITIVYLVTGKFYAALEIGGFEVVAKIVLYYLHERIWLIAPSGSIRKLFVRN